jgi:hypothetical protein
VLAESPAPSADALIVHGEAHLFLKAWLTEIEYDVAPERVNDSEPSDPSPAA